MVSFTGIALYALLHGNKDSISVKLYPILVKYKNNPDLHFLNSKAFFFVFFFLAYQVLFLSFTQTFSYTQILTKENHVFFSQISMVVSAILLFFYHGGSLISKVLQKEVLPY